MWSPITTALLGIWLIASTTLFGAEARQATINYICGPLIITIAVIAFWELNRNFLKCNIAVAAFLLVFPFFHLPQDHLEIIVSNSLTALAVMLLAFVKRKLRQRYGGGWSSLFQPYHPHPSGHLPADPET